MANIPHNNLGKHETKVNISTNFLGLGLVLTQWYMPLKH